MLSLYLQYQRDNIDQQIGARTKRVCSEFYVNAFSQK